ncbi:MAG: polysaccharide deacetylase family protein, partial [Sphingobacteriales bacterium]
MNRIINFHEVYDREWFESLVIYLKSRYTMVSMDQLNEFYSGGTKLDHSCHLTVDDGEQSFYDVIFPVLRKHNIAASLFISPAVIAKRENYWFQEIRGYDSNELRRCISFVTTIPFESMKNFDVVWILKSLRITQIRSIIARYQLVTHTAPKAFQNISIENLHEIVQSDLVTIGAHTLNHPVLMNEDNLSAEEEIRSSIEQLSAMLNKEIRYFAYPNGTRNFDFTEREERILERNGIQLA